jgi:hypothetical protein
MIGWIRPTLAPRLFEGAHEKTRTAGVVHIIALALAASQLIAVLVPIYGGSADRRHILSGSAVILSIFAIFLNRRGQVRAASIVLVVGVWILLTAGACTAGGFTAPRSALM